jgi:hypothetical protein
VFLYVKVCLQVSLIIQILELYKPDLMAKSLVETIAHYRNVLRGVVDLTGV